MREKILTILAEIDPLGLVSFGAPDDEYSPEVPGIQECLDNFDELTPEHVLEVFDKMFYKNCIDLLAARQISERINRECR